jgi:hypothetical protein
VVGRAPAVRPALSSRVTFTRTLDPSFQTAPGTQSAPPHTWEAGRSVLPAPDPGAGAYPRNGPPPVSSAESRHVPPLIDREMPANRWLPPVSPRITAGIAAHGSARTARARGAAATNAGCGVRMAAERDAVIAGSFVRRLRCKRKREARPIAPFPGQSRLADQPRGAWCCADGMGRDSRFVAPNIIAPLPRRQGPGEAGAPSVTLQHRVAVR